MAIPSKPSIIADIPIEELIEELKYSRRLLDQVNKNWVNRMIYLITQERVYTITTDQKLGIRVVLNASANELSFRANYYLHDPVATSILELRIKKIRKMAQTIAEKL